MFNPSNGDRLRIRNTAIVITDGQSNVMPGDTIPEADLLKEVADVFVIGVTNEIDLQELLVDSLKFLFRRLAIDAPIVTRIFAFSMQMPSIL